MLLTTNVLQNISRLCLPCAEQDHQINLKSKHSRKCCQSSIILDIAKGKKNSFGVLQFFWEMHTYIS